MMQRSVTLVTGAGGFLGRRVLEGLPAGPVVAVVRAAAPALPAGVARLTVDLSAPDAVARLRSGLPDGPLRVIHLAGDYTSPADRLFDANVLTTLHLLEAVGDRVRHLTYASSVAVYGMAAARGGQPAAPDTPYGRTKLLAELALDQYARLSGVPVAVLRIASLYGPGNPGHNAVGRLTTVAASGGQFHAPPAGRRYARDYLYVGDAARAVQAASRAEIPGTFDIGSGRALAPGDLVDVLARLGARLRVAGDLRGPLAGSFGCDPAPARRALGLPPPVDLAEGVHEELAWRRGQRAGATADGPAAEGTAR